MSTRQVVGPTAVLIAALLCLTAPAAPGEPSGEAAATEPKAIILLFNNGPMTLPGSGNEMTRWTQAEDFEAITSSIITEGTFGLLDGSCNFPTSWDGTLRWWIYTGVGGLPATQVDSAKACAVQWTKVRDDCGTGGYAYYDVRFDLGRRPTVQSGVRYWLALHMASNWAGLDDLYWAQTSPGNYALGAEQYQGTASWLHNSNDHAFSLSASTESVCLFVDDFESGDLSAWSSVVGGVRSQRSASSN